MRLSELRFEYPEDLVALEPCRPSRVMAVEGTTPHEKTWSQFLSGFGTHDVLVVNETRVVPRRIFAQTSHGKEFEILFIESQDGFLWQVLCPATRLKPDDEIFLPDGIQAHVTERGRVQMVRTSRALDLHYFEMHGDVPLPPYIQKTRGLRRARTEDREWYQTRWARQPGSSAAPTASLHFSAADLTQLERQGVAIYKLTLHVGLGTYLPVLSEDLKDHPMHSEYVEVPAATWAAVQAAREHGQRVWALGTTTLRALESVAAGKLVLRDSDGGGWSGWSDLLITPGFPFRIVSGLLTNFHQPESTLLALVCAFSDRQTVMASYAWAMERKFRLFSYGDLTAWTR